LAPGDLETLKRFGFVTYMSKPTVLGDYFGVARSVNKLLHGGLRRSQTA
jgi:hypothetical protein